MAVLTKGNGTLAGLVVVFVLVLAALVGATSPLQSLTKLDVGVVQVFEPSEVNLPLHIAAAKTKTGTSDRGSFGWDRAVQFHLPVQSGKNTPKAVFIAAAGGPGGLYINGINIAQTTPQLLPGPARGGYILSRVVNQKYLNFAENRIDVVLGPDHWRRGMPEVRVGSQEQVDRATEHYWQSQRLASILALAAGLIGVLAAPAVLAVTRGFLAGLGGAMFGAFLLTLWAIGEGLFGLEVVALLGPISGWVIVVGGVIAAAGSSFIEGRLAGLWLGLAISCILAGLCSLGTWAVQPALPFCTALGDLAPMALAGIGMPVLLATGASRLIRERTEARAEADRQALVVARQADEIQRQAQSLAITEERKRFSRDIHDGIGGQLVSLLWRVRSEAIPTSELAGEIERGLADLRLVVDALDDGPVNLSDAMWNFAARARQQLDAAAIAFTWDLPDELNVEWQDSRRILSLYRMLQEATSNVVRHSKATELSIRFIAEPKLGAGAMCVLIEDNGIGLDPEARPNGRGLSNLMSRAAQLGGTLMVSSPQSGSGTRIEIILPPEPVAEH
jgi:signal transduction histidine kinase